MRRFSHITPEYRREMRLRLKPDAERDIHKALPGVLEKRLRPDYALPQQVFVRTHSDAGAKLGREMHPRQSGGFRKICEPYWLLHMRVDVLVHAREPPLWKGSDGSSLPVRPRYQSTATDPCKRRHAQRVRVDTGQLGWNSTGARQIFQQRLDARISQQLGVQAFRRI